ncbi:hypothetical protein TorRG33x02_311790, partial [Trema orientale]
FYYSKCTIVLPFPLSHSSSNFFDASSTSYPPHSLNSGDLAHIPNPPAITSSHPIVSSSPSPPKPCHPMVTRLKACIIKPKVFIITRPICESLAKPTSVT